MSQGGPSKACNILGPVPVTIVTFSQILRSQNNAGKTLYYKAALLSTSSLERLNGPDSQQVRTCGPMPEQPTRPLGWKKTDNGDRRKDRSEQRTAHPDPLLKTPSWPVY